MKNYNKGIDELDSDESSEDDEESPPSFNPFPKWKVFKRKGKVNAGT